MRPVPSSKISIPELPPDLVHRTELLRQLDSAADVALVSAPAGYGKTLLVAEWARASTEVDTAWVRLDQDDNDQRRLWSAVLASVARARTRSADGPLLAGFDDRGWDMESAGRPDFLAKLIEALSALPRPLRLVLDDLHEVTDAATLHGLQNFLRDRPSNVVLVLVSRLDPPFHLHRLRLEGGLTELRSNRLQFDRVEAGTLLRRAGLALTPRQVDQLYQQTDGWPAGLRLAAAAAPWTRPPTSTGSSRTSPATSVRSRTTWSARCSPAFPPTACSSCRRPASASPSRWAWRSCSPTVRMQAGYSLISSTGPRSSGRSVRTAVSTGCSHSSAAIFWRT